MQMQVQITAEFKEDALEIGMEGEDMGVLMEKEVDAGFPAVSGKFGSDKEKEAYIRVKLDTENYRSRRKRHWKTWQKILLLK